MLAGKLKKHQGLRVILKSETQKCITLYDNIFLTFQQELDSKYDKHERLVKLSRDCTIKSKRVIFALHRISGSEYSKNEVLTQAREKVSNEILVLLKAVALEIDKDDPKKHHTAFSPGLQEFIEALSFLIFLRDRRLIDIKEMQYFLTFKDSDCPCVGDISLPGTQCSELILPLDPIDYALGIADMTGELMRICINAVGCGYRDLPFNILPFIKAIYIGFLSLKAFSKEFSRKLNVMKNSLIKVESVCYTLKIRGSETPGHIFLHAIASDKCDNENFAGDLL